MYICPADTNMSPVASKRINRGESRTVCVRCPGYLHSNGTEIEVKANTVCGCIQQHTHRHDRKIGNTQAELFGAKFLTGETVDGRGRTLARVKDVEPGEVASIVSPMRHVRPSKISEDGRNVE